MTSPVDFISGPSTVSTAGPKRANGNTASLTPTWLRCVCWRLKLGEGLARHDPGGDLGDRQADHLGDERHGARGARIDLQHVDVAVLDGVLHVHQPADLQRQRQLAGLPAKLGDRFGLQVVRRQRAGGVAGMDAGLLDMLHDAGDEGVPAVGQAVDIDLDGVAEVAVEQQRVLAQDRVDLPGLVVRVARLDVVRHELRQGAEQIVGKLLLFADDLHRPAAQHVGRAAPPSEIRGRRRPAGPARPNRRCRCSAA